MNANILQNQAGVWRRRTLHLQKEKQGVCQDFASQLVDGNRKHARKLKSSITQKERIELELSFLRTEKSEIVEKIDTAYKAELRQPNEDKAKLEEQLE